MVASKSYPKRIYARLPPLKINVTKKLQSVKIKDRIEENKRNQKFKNYVIGVPQRTEIEWHWGSTNAYREMIVRNEIKERNAKDKSEEEMENQEENGENVFYHDHIANGGGWCNYGILIQQQKLNEDGATLGETPWNPKNIDYICMDNYENASEWGDTLNWNKKDSEKSNNEREIIERLRIKNGKEFLKLSAGSPPNSVPPGVVWAPKKIWIATTHHPRHYLATDYYDEHGLKLSKDNSGLKCELICLEYNRRAMTKLINERLQNIKIVEHPKEIPAKRLKAYQTYKKMFDESEAEIKKVPRNI